MQGLQSLLIFNPLYITLVFFLSCENSFKYPKTEKSSNVVDIYHGQSIEDDYRWLEDDNSKQTNITCNYIAKPKNPNWTWKFGNKCILLKYRIDVSELHDSQDIKIPFKELSQLHKKLKNIDFYNSSVDFETGPGYLRSGIRLNDNYLIFPTKYFYPFVEEYSPGQDPSYRKSSKNKCHSKKKKKRTNKRLKSGKGYLKFPCDKYPNSYALKHWQLGKSWLISEYYTE